MAPSILLTTSVLTTLTLSSAYRPPIPREVNYPDYPNDYPGTKNVQGVVSDCTGKSHTSCFECVSTPQSTYFGVVTIDTPCS